MKKETKNHQRLLFWRFLTYFWGIIAGVFFILDYFKILDCSPSLKTLAVVYISILSIFTSIKEFQRWKSKNFFSRYHGEIFVIAYSILMVLFIFLDIFHVGKYKIPIEFTTTYLAILGIFAISYNSKYLKNK